MLMIAIVAGLAAVMVAVRWMQGLNTAPAQQRIAVAAAEVPLGSRITGEMVRLVEWPDASVPPGSFAKADDVVGRVVTSTVQRGEPLIEGRLAPVGAKAGLSAIVPEGKRAMTVRVNDVIGVAGFALPGTFVDVLVNTQEEGSKNSDRDRTISKIVLERILVLAVAQEADRDSTKPQVVNAVTLELTPAQAELLDLARSVGSLSLVLRNQAETAKGSSDGMTKADLLGLKAATPVAVAAAAPAPRRAAPVVVRTAPVPVSKPRDCVEVIRGVTKSMECF
jgi:pilus assembly protein CpaB